MNTGTAPEVVAHFMRQINLNQGIRSAKKSEYAEMNAILLELQSKVVFR